MFGLQRTEERRLHNGAFVASSKLLDEGAAFLLSCAAMAPMQESLAYDITSDGTAGGGVCIT